MTIFSFTFQLYLHFRALLEQLINCLAAFCGAERVEPLHTIHKNQSAEILGQHLICRAERSFGKKFVPLPLPTVKKFCPNSAQSFAKSRRVDRIPMQSKRPLAVWCETEGDIPFVCERKNFAIVFKNSGKLIIQIANKS